MEYPNIIKTDQGEYPIEDIKNFRLVHKPGGFLKMIVKKVLTSKTIS